MVWRFARGDLSGQGGGARRAGARDHRAGLRLVVGGPTTGAAASDACPDAPHRFETLALFAPALERAKQILVYLPPGYDCAPARRYPVFYFNDGHDLFDWDPAATGLEPALAAEIAAREARGTAAGASRRSSTARAPRAACRR
jgi:enterochelin esterase-like enzyme